MPAERHGTYISCGSLGNEAGVYSLAYQTRDLALAGPLFSQRVVA
jgi:hypothetical protein